MFPPHTLRPERRVPRSQPDWAPFHQNKQMLEGPLSHRLVGTVGWGETSKSDSKCPLGRPPLTWGLRGTGLQVTGLPADRLHQGVAAADDVGALVALHVAHAHTRSAGLGALMGNSGQGTPVSPGC